MLQLCCPLPRNSELTLLYGAEKGGHLNRSGESHRAGCWSRPPHSSVEHPPGGGVATICVDCGKSEHLQGE